MIVWTKAIATLIENVDAQHRELFNHANRFFAAAVAGAPGEELGRLVEFMREYTLHHFRSEEEYFDRLLLTEEDLRRNNKKAHQAFIRDLVEFEQDLKRTEERQQLSREIQHWITNWLLLHIGKIDCEMGKALRSAFPFMHGN
jgi:hemerythrin-like metal-binding protein